MCKLLLSQNRLALKNSSDCNCVYGRLWRVSFHFILLLFQDWRSGMPSLRRNSLFGLGFVEGNIKHSKPWQFIFFFFVKTVTLGIHAHLLFYLNSNLCLNKRPPSFVFCQQIFLLSIMSLFILKVSHSHVHLCQVRTINRTMQRCSLGKRRLGTFAAPIFPVCDMEYLCA